MAFGFFRRRQKMVVVIMAVLMVSFLVGFQGLQMLLSRSRDDISVGRTSEGEVKRKHVWSAQTDMSILRYLGLDKTDFLGRPVYPTGRELMTLTSNNRDAALTYTLLLIESEKEGVTVSDADVQDFLSRQLGISEQAYRGVLSALRQAQRGITDERIREALKNWLMIHRTFIRSLVTAPPSERNVRHLARDVTEEIRVQVLHIPAEKFLEQAAEADANAVDRQFAEYRNAPAGVYQTAGSFGFGYLIAAQVQIRYALIRRDAVRRAARPAEKDIYEYYKAHKGELLTEDGKQKTIAQAWPEIVETLQDQAASQSMRQIVRRMRELVTEYAERHGDDDTGHAYGYAKDQMTVSGEDIDAILRRQINVQITKASIEKTLETLAKRASIDAINYPYGKTGKESLDPNIQISIKGEMTLGGALTELSRQAQWQDVRWGAIEGLERSLFPLGDADFPIVVKETALIDARQIAADDVLGKCKAASARGVRSLAEIAFTSKPFADPTRPIPGLLAIGQEATPMIVDNERGGTLLWQLVAARGARVPEKLTDDLKKQVRADLKLVAAFAKAHEAARKIDTGKTFEEAVAKKESLTTDTDWLTRKQMQPYSGRIVRSAVEVVKLPESPGVSPRAMLKAQTELNEAFLNLAFSVALLPEDVEPPTPAKSKSVAVLQVPARREVLVLRRIGYGPLVKSAYDEQSRTRLFGTLLSQRMQVSAAIWFAGRNVAARVAYEGQRR